MKVFMGGIKLLPLRLTQNKILKDTKVGGSILYSGSSAIKLQALQCAGNFMFSRQDCGYHTELSGKAFS